MFFLVPWAIYVDLNVSKGSVATHYRTVEIIALVCSKIVYSGQILRKSAAIWYIIDSRVDRQQLSRHMLYLIASKLLNDVSTNCHDHRLGTSWTLSRCVQVICKLYYISIINHIHTLTIFYWVKHGMCVQQYSLMSAKPYVNI